MQKTQHESSSPSSSSSVSGSGTGSGPDSPDSTAQTPGQVNDEQARPETDTAPPAYREYDRSGLYPSGGGKAFRIWALLGWLAGVIVVLAGVSALLNILLLG